jgi:hypothetical protein
MIWRGKRPRLQVFFQSPQAAVKDAAGDSAGLCHDEGEKVWRMTGKMLTMKELSGARARPDSMLGAQSGSSVQPADERQFALTG